MQSPVSRASATWMLLGLGAVLPAHGEPLELAPQSVTATRTSQPARASLAATTVIDRDAIERSQAHSVPELLRQVPGVTLSNNGGPGKNTTLFMRGTESDHVLVLVDGVKVGSVSAGLTAFQDLPVELIERIEVVRGPRSSLYGSEAIGGVIQIFTRKGHGDDAAKPWFSAGYGTHDSYQGSAGVAGGDEEAWYSLGFSSQDSDGINAKKPDRFDSSIYEPDSDGYRNISGHFRAGYTFDSGLELDGSVLRTRGHNDYDGIYDDWDSGSRVGFHSNADVNQTVLGARARYSPLDPWTLTLQVGRSDDKTSDYRDGVFDTRIDTRRDSAAWLNDISLADGHTLTVGVDWQHEQVSSNKEFGGGSRLNKGWFAQYIGEHEQQDWQLSLRRDDNEQFGTHDTGSAAWGYAFTDELRFSLSYGTAFKAPSFNELYYPQYGNPELGAETSESFEVGLSGQHDWGHWSANLFRSHVDDLIAYDSTILGPNNIGKARIDGLELVLGSQWLGWDWSANATFIDAVNRDHGSNAGNELPRRPQQSFNLDLDRRIGRFGVGATLHAEGRSYDDLANRNKVAGYATLDLRGEYWLTEEWRLQAKVTNLLDADYETALDYNQPGQAVYFSVRYQAL